MASTLNTKINSYAIENGIEFSQAYALVPNQTGTNTETLSSNWAKSGRDPLFESAVNPPNGSGSWRMLSNGTNQCYHRTRGGNIIGRFRDHDWVTGIWVKFNSLATGISMSTPFWRLDPTATSGFEFGYTTYADGRPPQFYVRGSGAQEILVGQIVFDTWYLLSVNRIGNIMTHYINGQSVSIQTRNSTELQTNFGWGTTTFYEASINISNQFVAASSVITPEDITDIYITGMNLLPTDVTASADPMTADAAPGPGHQRLQQELVKGIGLLDKKIHSYTLENAIEFNSSYQLPPVQTGPITDTNSAAWNILGGGAPTYQPEIGPNNGEGSWNFTTTYTKSDRMRCVSSTIVARMNDYDISAGIWYRINDFANTNINFNYAFYGINPSNTLGYVFGIMRNDFSFGREVLCYTIQIESALYYVDPDVVPVNLNTWNYFAVRRNGAEGANGTYKFYINGQQVYSKQINSTTNNALNIVYGTFTGSPTVDMNISINLANSYITTYSDIDEVAIQEIWDIGKSPALQDLSSNVNNQITSYNLLRGIRFNENYKDPYTQTGSITNTTDANFTLTGNAPVYDPGIAGATEGGWTFTGTNSATSRVRDAGSIKDYFEYDSIAGQTQTDWSIGFWAKINTWPTSFATLVRTEASSSNTEDFVITYGTDSITGKKAIDVKVGQGATQRFGNDLNLQTGEWYYFALRRIGGDGAFYLNGLPIGTFTALGGFLVVNVNYLTFGNASALANSFTISNFYLARNSVINTSQIQEIWKSRNTLNFNETVFPLTAFGDMLGQPQKGPTAEASALMVNPIIAATIGDSTNISASTTASAEFVNPTVLTGQWILVPNIQLGTANALQVFPFNIETNLDRSISVAPFLATAISGEHKTSEFPFIATALFVNPTVQIDENYLQKVLNLNPLIYINDGQSNPVNLGSMQESNYYSQYIDFNVDSTQEMQAVNNTKSWKANANGIILHEPRFQVQFANDTWPDKLDELYASRSLSIEFWYYSIGHVRGAGFVDPNEPISETNYAGYRESGSLFTDGITEIAEVYDWFACGPTRDASFKMLLIAERMKTYDFGTEGPNAFATWRTYYDATPERNDWNHIVITYEPVVDINKVRRYIYLNGQVVGNEILEYTFGSGLTQTPANQLLSINTLNAPSGPIFGPSISLSGSQQIKLNDGVLFDEFAYYPTTMTASQVLDRYSFVKSQSPNEIISPDPIELEASMGDANVFPIINFEYETDPITALAGLIPQPVMTTGFDKVVAAELMQAAAFIIEPTHQHGSTISHTEFVAYAESPNAFHLNTIYYDYVQANIAPYRYVTFDSSEPYIDYGTDIDYAVANFVINGVIVNPDFGINGKSVKSTGAYTNGALVIKESEHFDNWGTGANSWHSSFWMQRALDDNSTGLRVLWNLNGHNDDQNIILYHYNNKLHLQINNQVAAPITISTPNNVNPFDFGLHHFVINSHHNNNKNHMYLYMDGLLIADQDIGTYQVDVVNNPIHVGANDEVNNFPRLGIGTLITPFANTALPVVPTGISVYFDEIHWDKNQILAGEVAALFSALPGKITALIFGEAITASAQSVMPALTTTANYLADPMTASAESGDHTVFAVLNNIETAEPMTAFVEMLDAARIDNVNISAAFMFASAFIGGAGTPRVVTVAAFTGNAELANRRVLTGGITVNGIKIFDAQSAWVQFIKITNESSLLPMDGVR